MSDPKRATIWWNDAHRSSDTNADTEKIIKEHRAAFMGVMAWIILDDDVGVSFAFERTAPEQNDHAQFHEWRGYGFIPRGMIDRIEYLATDERHTSAET